VEDNGHGGFSVAAGATEFLQIVFERARGRGGPEPDTALLGDGSHDYSVTGVTDLPCGPCNPARIFV